MTKQEERAYWLAWSEVPGIGSVLLQRLHQQFGTLAEAWKASASELGAVEGFGVRLIERVVKMRGQYLPEQLLEQHLVKNPCFWTPADGEYPRLLLEIPSPPPRLYYSGVVDLAENYGSKPIVGIVGTRNPSEYGKRWTRKISATLAKHGFTVVSGMAVGIDTQAHRGCLEAGGRTIAVLGTGLDVVYPLSNSYLYKQIQEQGLVISEYPASTKPARSNFPQRNRIIAGLSRAVLVMEAPNKSGALITARLANEFCRDVYALPGSLDNPNSIGCLGLLNRGAHVILSEGHLLEMLGAIPELDPHSAIEQPLPALPVPTLEPALAKVLDAIAFEPTSFDIIVQQAALEAGSVSSALLQLELMGLVSQAPGMRYRRLITE
ncbi:MULTISPECIES: DNA-processing protein DprA [unclassified Moorena]|uniref:DNA-processing protein DprA n=1 Tax=unclassified Moorena TaxID=2683338 RepID=UPI0013BCDD92|nr:MULTISPECIES: DNA-processing protein DprA [unclassified Moorena]NEQ16176.1 DNA-protecting protein DprA [Moorena sp. SIO3E2]NER91741.1 DNA-protecting protein DprA [Moorena sp. SIO3A2]NES44682.1 DNA-protecting protein DprA [Moorena sp. SIO2C4]